MTDISVIVLVGKEELHIKRCLERLAPLEPKQVFVVESQNGDNTHDLAIETAKNLGWSVEEGPRSKVQGQTEEGENPPLIPHPSSLITVFHAWPGLYAKQFNWALDNMPVEGAWILRLDADEYLTPGTIEKLKNELSDIPATISGLNIELKRRFCGGEIRHATNGIRQTRIFRRGCGRCEEREMDEHVELTHGEIVKYDGAFYDDNLNDMSWWRAKHRGYAQREAADALAFARGDVHFVRGKELYYRLPPYVRPFLYFGIRYFLRGGFLDGYPGWMWNFWQGLWYRCRVDYEIWKRKRGNVAHAPYYGESHPADTAEIKKTDITVIILTGREELHIGRCLEKLAPLAPKQIIVVESQKGDRTHEIAEATARKLGWQVKGEDQAVPTPTTALHLVWHDYPGNQAEQFNWTLDNLNIKTSWILRLDADEYLLPELIAEIREKLPTMPDEIGGIVLRRRHYFAGGWAKHGTYPARILRLFRTGRGARYPAGNLMDERLKVAGEVIDLTKDFVDHSLVSMHDWRTKHRGYAKREARQAVESMKSGNWVDFRKSKYYRLPRYFRAFAYFSLRYFIKGGIWDGYAGFMWNFWQGLWYRCRVDYEIGKLVRRKVVSSVDTRPSNMR